MVQFKSCPRCCGDLVAAGDMYGRYVQCLQCGYMNDMPFKRVPQDVQRAQQSMRQRKEQAQAAGT